MPATRTALRRTCLNAGLAACIGTLLGGCAAPPAAPQTQAQRNAQVLKDAGFRPVQDGWEFSLDGRLLFASDTAELDPEMLAAAHRLGRQLAPLELARMRVEGHADSVGGDAYNQALSLRRAQAVARALAEAGVRAQIDTVGLGKGTPLNENRTAEQRHQNRRVAVVVPAQ